MKIEAILILLILVGSTVVLVNNSHAAEINAKKQSEGKTINKIAEVQKIMEDAKEADYLNLKSIYCLDVYDYFNLDDEYNTELKKKVFEKSQAYKDKLKSLKKLKHEMMTNYYMFSAGEIDNYDIKRKGFKLSLGTNLAGVRQGPSKSPVEGFYFPSLPTKKKGIRGLPGVYGESLLLPTDEENGMDIENNKESIRIYFIFKLNDMRSI